MSRTKIGALQIGASLSSTQDTLDKILGYEEQIKLAGCELVVLPEAILGGYPKGWDFGTRVGYRTDEGRAEYLAYWNQAVDLDGAEINALKQLAKRTTTNLVVGIIERRKSSLYCSTVTLSEEGEVAGLHRKLMPTASERLIWAQGDGSTMPVIKTTSFKMASAICWENYMPLYRAAMYAKGINLWCVSTVDDREIWQVSMRHIAYEGRMFVVSACQYQPAPAELNLNPNKHEGWPADKPMINGGSVIISPMGDILAGPLWGQEGFISAEVDTNEVVKGRYDFDAAGHYARPDVFQLSISEEKRLY